MGSPFTRPRRSGIASPGASTGDAITRVQIGADPRLLVPTLDGPRATPLGTTTTITDTPGVRPMIGYVVIRGVGRAPFGTVQSVTVDDRPVAGADMGVTTVGFERDLLGSAYEVPGVILRVSPGNRRIRVSASDQSGTTTREYSRAVLGNTETDANHLSWSGPMLAYPESTIPLFVEWSEMPIAGVGAVRVIGMPPGAGLRLDGNANAITPDPRGRFGYWAGWVGGNPASGTGLIRGVPAGRHRLKIIGTDGSEKSFDVDVPESPGGGSEFNLASGAYPSTTRIASIDYASAQYDAGRRPPTSTTGQSGEGAPFTLDVSPVDVAADTGSAVEVRYTVSTTRTDSTGTPQRVTLRVSDPSTGGGLAARGLTARFGSTTINAGESTTLTITGPAVSTPSTARFLVQADGPGAPSTPILREIAFAAPRPDDTSSNEDDSTLSTPVILAAVAVVAGGAWLLLRSPRSNPARRRRGRR